MKFNSRLGGITAALGLAIGISLGGAAQAEPLNVQGASDDEWRFTLTPYLFLPVSTTGTSVVADGEVDVDLDLSDVLELLNMAASVRGEAWRGDLGLVLDAYYVNLGGGGDFTGPASTSDRDLAGKRRWAAPKSGGSLSSARAGRCS